MGSLKDLKNDIAASLYIKPATERELSDRDFLKTTSFYGVQRLVMWLEKEDAVYYKGDVIHVKKKWAKKNLQSYDLDFSTKKEKELIGMTEFARQVYKNQSL